MHGSLSRKIFHREITDSAVRSGSYRKIYGDRSLIDDLDIVNELGGHSGCVNALSWSKSGNLLASGSDDQHLNIHTYQPSTTQNQFQLTTTVATGHTQNIFSVKFMPHSNDRTVITAAGDGEVRIFDLEYAGQAREASAASMMASEGRRRGRAAVYNGVRYLTDGDTDCRVYRSHGDRVKRIVTESSPHLFLTCSEDGEVRQWDLRQPSSAYPAPSGNRHTADSSVPPPLISYKRYSLDLNTISCSASQPHYIALGGAHLHAFLHDRRMMGRDRLQEAGRPLGPVDQLSQEEQELLTQATQCVRKFAPRGQRQMKRSDTGHITACKISDARPDEMVVSWSGDHIYSFDLVREPSDEDQRPIKPSKSRRAKDSRDRKRKRRANGSETSLNPSAGASSRQRTTNASATGQGASVRIHYTNGQSEDIPIMAPSQRLPSLNSTHRIAQRIAKSTAIIRSRVFGREMGDPASTNGVFISILRHAAGIIGDINQTICQWGYPMNPTPQQVLIQRGLRKDREHVRRFVQAAGTLCRVLGGRLETPYGENIMMPLFDTVDVWAHDVDITHHEQFRYDFLKAVLLWLDSGVGGLIESFIRPEGVRAEARAGARLPIPASEAGVESIDEFLIPYLHRLASDRPVLNFDANRFEVDATRYIFPTEKVAVNTFANAVKIPFEDLSSAASRSEGPSAVQAQDRQAARRFWALKVARGVLYNAADNLDSAVVDRAFGGLGRRLTGAPADESIVDPIVSEDEDGEEEAIHGVEIVDPDGETTEGANAEDIMMAAQETVSGAADSMSESENGGDAESTSESAALLEEIDESQSRHATVEAMDHDQDEEDDDMDVDDEEEDKEDEEEDEEDEDEDEDEDHDEQHMDEDDDEDDDLSSEPDEEDGVPMVGPTRWVYRSAFERSKLRPKVEPNTPAVGPTRLYQGHCNVRTVKDVNYFGPDDEYVVSGSDDGNFFIWDRKTSELVNVLEGDGEVVNVIQGHPYETMMAVSGIDSTIKIFSPDARAREVACRGEDVQSQDAASLGHAWPVRFGHIQARHGRDTQGARDMTATSAPASAHESTERYIDDDAVQVGPHGLPSRRRKHDAHAIIENNDLEREGGNQEAMITRALLAQLAQRVSQARALTGRVDAARTFNLDDDCAMQ